MPPYDGPAAVYVLQVTTPEGGWSRPAVFGSVRSAKRAARSMLSGQPDPGELTWVTDNEDGDEDFHADWRDGVRFVIVSNLVHP